jgi:hypothetical protein
MSTEQLHTTPQPSVENTEPTKEKKRSKKGLYTGLGVAGASTALAVSLFAGFSNSNNGEAAPEPGQPVPTDIAEPNEPGVDGQSPEVEPENPEQIEFGNNPNFESSPNELASQYVELMENWVNSGAELTLIDDVLEENKSWEEYLPELAARNAQAFQEQHTINDKGEDVANFIDRFEEVNLNVLENYSYTAFGDNPDNVEAYRFSFDTDNTTTEIQNDGSVRVIEFTLFASNNGDKNVSETGSGQARVAATFQNVDGKAVLVSLKNL